jgi:hypothetical protein
MAGFLQYHTISGKAQRQAKRAVRKERRKGKPKLIKKIALAIPRNAFLAAVALNLNKMAEKLFAKMQHPTDEAALKSKWLKLGGDYNKLKNTVLKKVKNKRLAGWIDDDVISGYIGIAPAALLASALPIIKALAEFLGKQKDASIEVTDEGIEETTAEETAVETVEGMPM